MQAKSPRRVSTLRIPDVSHIKHLASFTSHEVWTGVLGDGRSVSLTSFDSLGHQAERQLEADVELLNSCDPSLVSGVLVVGLASLRGFGAKVPTIVTERAARAVSLANTPMNWAALHPPIAALLRAVAELHRGGNVHGGLELSSFGWFNEADGDWVIKLRSPRFDSLLGNDRPGQVPVRNSSPERLRSRHHRSVADDVFALGCIVARICSNRELPCPLIRPERDRRRWTLPDLAPSFSEPPRYRWWLNRMLAVHPDDRFASADAALAELPEQLLYESASGDWGPVDTAIRTALAESTASGDYRAFLDATDGETERAADPGQSWIESMF